MSGSGVADGGDGRDLAIGLVLGLIQFCSAILSDLGSSLLTLLSCGVCAGDVVLVGDKDSVTHVLQGVLKSVGGANVLREKMGHLSLFVPVEPAALLALTLEAELSELSLCHPCGASNLLDVSAKILDRQSGLGSVCVASPYLIGKAGELSRLL